MAVPWLVVGQLVLGNLDKILAVVKPAFTRRRVEAIPTQTDLLNQQIAELQAASSNNAEQIGQLAAQLKEVVATISQSAVEAAAQRAATRRLSLAALVVAVIALVFAGVANAEVTRHAGSPDALPDKKYIHAVSEADSPVQQTWIKARDGVYVAAAVRKPKGAGPFPALIMFHGAPGGRGMDQLVGWSRGDHGGPVWERFLQEGYVVVVADYRGGDWELMNTPSPKLVTAIDDGISVIDYVQNLPYVDRAKVSVYGVSLGGNLVMFLASRVPTLHAVVAGAPAPIWFLGYKLGADGARPDFAKTPPDAAASKANIAPIKAPVLILVGTEDRLMPLDIVLHDELVKHGKSARLEIYEHGYHDFVLGNQGQKRGDLPQGEKLIQGALDALELTVKFVKDAR
jgi:dienelactone hydrolase